MGNEAETNTESRAGLAVARSDSVGPTALRYRESSAGVPPRTLNGEDGEDFHLIGITLVSFRARGVRSLWFDRSFFRMCTCGGRPIRIRSVGQVARPRRGDSVARNGCVGLTAIRCRQSGAGFPPRTLNWKEGEGFSLHFASLSYHFAPGGQKLMDRAKPFSHLHLRRTADPDLGVGQVAGRAVAIRDESQVQSGEVFGFELGSWLAA
jgi:hypothetical protein